MMICPGKICLSVLLSFAATSVSAQTHIETTPSPVQTASFATTIGDRQDDTKDQALAKTLDENNRRIKALEAYVEAQANDQKDKSFVDRFDAVEADVSKSMEQIGEIDSSMDDYVKSGHGDNRMKLSGRVHADYWSFLSESPGIDTLEGGDPQDRFGFRRLRFGVNGDIDDNMEYKIEMEFAGGNDVEFRDAYLGFTNLPLFNTVLIGNQKRPYGLDHLNSSRYNVFLERPFVIEAINQDARRLGISSYGHSDDLRYNWRYGVFNQELIQDTTGNYIGDDYQLEFASRLAKTWWWDEATDGRGYGHIAASSSYGLPDGGSANNQSRYRTRAEARSSGRWIDTGTIVGAETFILGGLESVLNVGPTQLVAEYQVVDVDRGAVGNNTLFHGGYLYASYFLTGEHMPWDRESGTLGRIKPFENFFSVCDCDGYRQRGLGAWQVAARYSYADFNDENIVGGIGSSLTLGLNWYWNPYARMQFNYLVGEVDRGQAGGDDYQIAGVRFMIDF